MPIIVHIDMNSFFASCEVKRNPALKGKEIIISGKTNRSIVSAASYEAKKKGIYTTMPYFQARQLCPNAYFFVGDYDYYHAVSHEIFSFLRNRYPLVEIASVDECYIEIQETIQNPMEYFKSLQKEIYETIHIPCSIGVSYNKFLAKMASDYQKPMGITFIKKKDVPKIIWPQPIQNMYGIGKASAKKLIDIQILTIGDLANKEDYRIAEILGSSYLSYLEHAQGKGISHIEVKEYLPKSVGHSHTLAFDSDDEEIIKKELYPLCLHVADRLQKLNMIGYTITLTLKDSEFVLKNKSKKMMVPTNDEDRIYIEAMKLLDYALHFKIRLVGVSISDLIFPEDYYQQLDIYHLNDIKMNRSADLIERFNEIAGQKLFMKAKDAKGSHKHE